MSIKRLRWSKMNDVGRDCLCLKDFQIRRRYYFGNESCSEMSLRVLLWRRAAPKYDVRQPSTLKEKNTFDVIHWRIQRTGGGGGKCLMLSRSSPICFLRRLTSHRFYSIFDYLSRSKYCIQTRLSDGHHWYITKHPTTVMSNWWSHNDRFSFNSRNGSISTILGRYRMRNTRH